VLNSHTIQIPQGGTSSKGMGDKIGKDLAFLLKEKNE
jgi:hypothetical protein